MIKSSNKDTKYFVVPYDTWWIDYETSNKCYWTTWEKWMPRNESMGIRSRNERWLGERPEFLSKGTALQRGSYEMPTTIKSFKNFLSVNV